MYETCDGKFVSIGAIEPQFYSLLLEKLGLGPKDLPDQMDRSAWPEENISSNVIITPSYDGFAGSRSPWWLR